MLKTARFFLAAAAVFAAGAARGEELTSKMSGGKIERDRFFSVPANKTGQVDGVTLAGQIRVDNRGELRVSGALTMEGGRITLAEGDKTSFETVLSLAKGASIVGKGTIIFQGGKTRNRVVTLEDKNPTVFGRDVELSGAGGGGQFRSLAGAPMRFEGALVVGPDEETMRFEGPMTIVGLLQVRPDAEAAIMELTNLSAGVLTDGTFRLERAALRVKEVIETNAAKLDLKEAKVLVGEKGTDNVLNQMKKNAPSGEIKIDGQQDFVGPFLNQGLLHSDDATLITKALINEGTLRAERLAVQGSLVLRPEGKLVMEINSPNLGGWNVVKVSGGKLSAGGTLEVNMAFEPKAGSAFKLLHGEVAGKFDKLMLPKLEGNLGWSDERLYSEGVLEVVVGAGNISGDVADGNPAKLEKPVNWILYIVAGAVVAAGATLWGWRRGKRAAK